MKNQFQPKEYNPDSISGRYLTLVLDNEVYGIAVLRVREIIRTQKVTPIPQMPEHIKGVINLRGRVIPVIDLRLKFGLKSAFTDRTCIVVVHVEVVVGNPVLMGLIVDYVEEVLNFTPEMIEPPPSFGASLPTPYILGLARAKGEVKILLDINRVIAPETVDFLAASMP